MFFTIRSDYLAQLWVPDLAFLGVKDSRRHDVTTPNVLLRLSPDGTVLLTQQLVM